MTMGETVTLAAIVVPLFGAVTTFIIRMENNHRKSMNALISLVKDNTSTSKQLNDTVQELRINVKENTEVTRQTKDKMSEVILEVVRSKR